MSQGVLQDQVVLITGAGRAPAPDLARAFAVQGAVVAVNDLSPTLLDPLVDSVRAAGGRIQPYIADSTRGMPLRAMLDEVLADHNRIDILVNNPRVRPEMALIDMDEWDWHRTIEMNLNGPFLVTQLVAKLMREQGGGVVLNIVEADPGVTDPDPAPAYTSSQAGLLAFSQAAAREFLAYNILVHTLCPDREILYGPVQDRSNPALCDLAVQLCSRATDHRGGQTFRVGKSQPNARPQE